MKIFLWLVGVLGGLAALLFVSGLFLPPARSLTREILINAPRVKVWQVITNYASQTQWRKSLIRVEILDATNGQERWREYPHRGPAISFAVVSSRAPALLDIRFWGGAHGTWQGELTETANGTLLRFTEHIEIRNPLLRPIAAVLFDLEKFMDAYATDLKAQVERNDT